MAAVQLHLPEMPQSIASARFLRNHSASGATTSPPRSVPAANPDSNVASNMCKGDSFSSTNEKGSYDLVDRVIKCGYLQKRTQKTKTWKSVFLVLRPNVLSFYKSEKQYKLRHKLYLSDLTAVAFLKDPKQKRENLIGLFGRSRNFHFQAPSADEAREWLDLIRREARLEEEEEEMFLAGLSSRPKHDSPEPVPPPHPSTHMPYAGTLVAMLEDRTLTSSPEPLPVSLSASIPAPHSPPNFRNRPMVAEYSGISGNELASHSDLSDLEGGSPHRPINLSSSRPSMSLPRSHGHYVRNGTQLILGSEPPFECEPDKVVWQGWLWFLRSRRGVKQWKNMWTVVRPRNMILYKDESEYTAQFILPLSSIIDVVDLDPVSRSKRHCMQIITDEKSYRFCAHGEEPLVHCLGAYKSMLARRKELELAMAVATVGTTAPASADANLAARSPQARCSTVEESRP